MNALRSGVFTITGEMTLVPGQDAADVVEQARVLGDVADAIQIPDHRNARPHMSNIAVASHLLRKQIDPVVHMNCRDRNRLALQSDLLGARSLGVTSLVLLRGAEFGFSG